MNPITVLNKSNVPTGPFTREQVGEKLQRGEIALTDLAFVEGLGFAQWTPLRDVLAKLDGAPAVVPPPPVVVAPPPVAPAYSYAATMQPPPHLIYAGFWIRLAAYLIDSIIITAITLAFAFVVIVFLGIIGTVMGISLNQFSSMNSQDANPILIVFIIIMEFAVWGGSIAVFWLYFAKQESGPAQATFGKRAMGLRVTDLTGQRLSFGHATGRTFGKIVSALPMDIGFLMAAFTERKQALHDMIAGTLVIRG